MPKFFTPNLGQICNKFLTIVFNIWQKMPILLDFLHPILDKFLTIYNDFCQNGPTPPSRDFAVFEKFWTSPQPVVRFGSLTLQSIARPSLRNKSASISVVRLVLAKLFKSCLKVDVKISGPNPTNPKLSISKKNFESHLFCSRQVVWHPFLKWRKRSLCKAKSLIFDEKNLGGLAPIGARGLTVLWGGPRSEPFRFLARLNPPRTLLLPLYSSISCRTFLHARANIWKKYENELNVRAIIEAFNDWLITSFW